MTEPAALAEAYAHCEAELKAADRGTWLATLFAPAEKRPSLHAFDAFLIEIGSVREKVREPLAGELRLQWWTDAIEGEARGDERGHPVAAALIDTIRRSKLPRAALTDLIEVKREDLYDEPIATTADFDAWAERTDGAAVALRAAILAGTDTAVAAAARHAGHAAAVLSAVRTLARQNANRTEVRLPLDLLNANGIGTAEVAIRQPSAALAEVLSTLAARAEAALAALRQLRPVIPAEAAPAFLTVNFVPPTLRRLARSRFDPFARPLDLPQWRKQWILWRAAGRNGIL